MCAVADLVSIGQACDMLGVSESTVRRMASEGRLTRYKLSKRVVRYSAGEIRRLIDGCGYRNDPQGF